MSGLGSVGAFAAIFVLSACGGGGSGADAMPTGPCPIAPFSMAWPSDDDARFCLIDWDGSKPELVLTECGEVLESCSDSGTSPDFSCIDTPPGAPPASPASVTMTGFVDVFSSGPSANGARIEVYRESDLANGTEFAAATPIGSVDVTLDATTLVGARACPKDDNFMQGQCVLPTEDCGGSCDKVLGAGLFCYQGSCEELQRWEVAYQVPTIPTNEFLVVRTVGLDNSGAPQLIGNTWAQMAQPNVHLSTADAECTSATETSCIVTNQTPALYQTNVNLLSAQDYMIIPSTAGLSAGIPPGNGAIAGEVHDCDGSRVQHAQIGFTNGRDPSRLVFFNGNPTATLPRIQQASLGTNTLSLYAGLDLEPGTVELVAVGNAAGTVREVGRFSTRIWPDTVTLLRIGGGRPAQ